MGAGQKYAAPKGSPAPVNDGRRRPARKPLDTGQWPRTPTQPQSNDGSSGAKKKAAYVRDGRTDATREVSLAADREQKMRVAARQQAMAHARAMARARSQSKVINQARASFAAADAEDVAADAEDAAATCRARARIEPDGSVDAEPGGARIRMEPSVTPERLRPESPKADAPGSGAKGFRHPSNRKRASGEASPAPPPGVEETSGLLAAADSSSGARASPLGLPFVEEPAGLTFVEELDLA